MGQHEDVPALVAIGDNLADGMSLETIWNSWQEGGRDRANHRCSYADIQYGVSKHGRLNQVTFDLKQQLNKNQEVAPDTELGIRT